MAAATSALLTPPLSISASLPLNGEDRCLAAHRFRRRSQARRRRPLYSCRSLALALATGRCPLSGVMEGGAVAVAKKLIERRMLIGIKDGRFFVGTFYCMDKQGNIILQDAVEYRSTRRSSPSPMEHRGVGLILIPSSCRTTCHVDCSLEDQLSLLSLNSNPNPNN